MRTLFRCLFLSISLVALADAVGQVNFIRRYDLPIGASITSIDATQNGNIYVAGYNGDAALVMCLDQFGNPIWSHNYGSTGTGPVGSVTYGLRPVAVIALDDGALIAATSRDLTSGGGNPYVDDLQRASFKLDLLGTIEWIGHDGTWWGDWYADGELSEGGTALMCGHRGSVNGEFAYVARVDVNTGEIINNIRFYGPNNSGDVKWIDENNGMIALTGSSTIALMNEDLVPIWIADMISGSYNSVGIYGASDSSAFVFWEDRMALISPAGLLDSLKLLDASDGIMAAIDGTPDETMIIAGNALDGSVWLSEMAQTGEHYWTKGFGETGESWNVVDLKCSSDGSILLLCEVEASSEMVIIMASSNGEVADCSFLLPDPVWSESTPSSYTNESYHSTFPVDVMALEPSSLPDYFQSEIVCSEELYTVTGRTFHDENSNGLFDTGEAEFVGRPVQIFGNGNVSYTFSNGYSFAVGSPGQYQITHDPGPFWTLTAGAGGHSIVFTDNDTAFTGMDFGYQASQIITNIEGSITTGPMRCNEEVELYIEFVNTGTTAPDLLISLTYDSLLTYLDASAEPDSFGNNILYWTVSQLGYFETGSITVQFMAPTVEHMGEFMESTLEVQEIAPFNNTLIDKTIESMITCSYDPNDKIAIPEGTGILGAIPPETSELYYTIRFQNTGNDTAYTVTIADQLSAYLEFASLQVLGSSHGISSLSVTSGGLAEFKFENIMLPDSGANEAASHGHVHFSVELHPDLPLGTTIVNNAAIYFDLNPPIITELVTNTLWDCSVDPLPVTINSVEAGSLTVSTPGFWPIADYFTIQWFLDGQLIEDSATGYLQIVEDGSYTAHVIDDYGCVAVAGPYQVIGLFVDQTSDGAVLFQPNPFTHGTMISFDVSGSPTFIEIFDIQGRSIRMIESNGKSQYYLERGDLEAGVYLIRVQQGAHINVAPVIAE
jgi:hypothetical protein